MIQPPTVTIIEVVTERNLAYICCLVMSNKIAILPLCCEFKKMTVWLFFFDEVSFPSISFAQNISSRW
jgi:hypothetical protein